MISLLSTKSGKKGLRGKEIENNTFVMENGSEAGVPHHYFDEQGIRELFRKWEIVSLADIDVTYIEEKIHYLSNPFPYTKWNVIVKKQNDGPHENTKFINFKSAKNLLQFRGI